MIEFVIQNAATIATIFFFLTFCYVVYSVFKKGSQKEFDQYAKIPLKDKDNEQK